ncbi:unnamed protein product [Allacma fusca]|uniref:Uncharacterized protein n=1 Tax=Allacma fusca TaxID=39272 RepID=A0A8J2NZ07_9HEXA|nr:unnamed protein product [Allacma fusca]
MTSVVRATIEISELVQFQQGWTRSLLTLLIIWWMINRLLWVEFILRLDYTLGGRTSANFVGRTSQVGQEQLIIEGYRVQFYLMILNLEHHEMNCVVRSFMIFFGSPADLPERNL